MLSSLQHFSLLFLARSSPKASVRNTDFPLAHGHPGTESQFPPPGYELTGIRYVLWLMYGLFPVAFPIAKLLDVLLGRTHGIVFNRLGLKTLLVLHEDLHHCSNERLSTEEITIMSSMLNFNDLLVTSVMTPIADVYSLSSEISLNNITRHNILRSGYSNIPIRLHTRPNHFIGRLPIKTLVSMASDGEMSIGHLQLQNLPFIYSTETCRELLHAFQDRKTKMLLVIEPGTTLPLGIVTARDLLGELIEK